MNTFIYFIDCLVNTRLPASDNFLRDKIVSVHQKKRQMLVSNQLDVFFSRVLSLRKQFGEVSGE